MSTNLFTNTGGRESNSFVTVEEADVLIAELFPDDATEWLALTISGKEQRLILGAKALGFFRLRGWRAYQGQALVFPRTAQDDPRIVPDVVKQAQVELAYNLIHRELVNMAKVSEGDNEGLRPTQISLGGVLMVSLSGKSSSAGSAVEKITRSLVFTTSLKLQKYITQVRGRTVDTRDTTLLTTTTTVAQSTTTTT
jgi:hypothetical protein